MGQLDGKVALITGASIGIGRGVADVFGAEGARLVLASRNQDKLAEASRDLGARGVSVLTMKTDVRKEDEIIALFHKTMETYGRLDILVNNAGVFDAAPLEEMSLELWQRVIDTNLTGPFLCTREAMKIMKPQGGGRIINIGSISAQMPRPHAAPYSCCKLALVALTKTTALEGRDFNISASCLHPGNTATAQMDYTPDEPMIRVDDIARTVLFMATLPPNATMLEAIVMPVTQAYLGRG